MAQKISLAGLKIEEIFHGFEKVFHGFEEIFAYSGMRENGIGIKKLFNKNILLL